MFYVYILKSIGFDKYYIGCSSDYLKRFKEHNKGLVKSSKAFKPYDLMIKQGYLTLSKARKIEKRLKDLKRKDYIDRIVEEKVIKMGA
ncbi:MAG: GIY-YIG nuclease family protein [Candidatus Roizmanbacteria bacterium]